jgi:hypothetical protein
MTLLTNSVAAAVVAAKPKRKYYSLLVLCDEAGFQRIKLLKSIWLRVIAAQQSNIVNDAIGDAAASSGRIPMPKNGRSLRVEFDGQSLERFESLISCWPRLTAAQQQHAVDTALLVSRAW